MEAIGLTTAAMVSYTVIAFYFRPEPNTDNRACRGVINDPFQSSDNVNPFYGG